MGTQEHTGLTLQGLARRLEALERENAELRSKVATLEGSEPGRIEEAASETGGVVSRRALLSRAGAAAVAAVAAGTILDTREAKANHLGPGISVDFVVTHNEAAGTTAVFGDAPNGEGVVGRGRDYGVRGTGNHGVLGKSSTFGFAGVVGDNDRGDGVRGIGKRGVWGFGETGVYGSSFTFGSSGVLGQFTDGTSGGHGVRGEGVGANFAGVLGRNDTGTGVRGEGSTTAENVAGVRGLGKTGVWGSSSTAGRQGVYGQHTGQGYGVVGDGRGSGNAGILGRNSTGYGGAFEGGQAQLRLKPAGTAGKPTTGTHSKGELYLDSQATLWLCVANGTPGTWRRFTTTA